MAPNDEEDVRSIETRAQVEALLSMPFEEALQQCEALRKYIDGNEEAGALREEFRQHWHPGAPAELCQVLEELLDPRSAAANAEASAAFEKDPLSAAPLPTDMLGGPGAAAGPVGESPFGGAATPPELGGGGFSPEMMPPHLRSPADAPLGGAGAMQLVEAVAAGEGGVADEIDRLLALSWDEAKVESKALAAYISNCEDSAEVEKEFRSHWSPEAPVDLRRVLTEVLDPAVKQAADADREAFSRWIESAAEGPKLGPVGPPATPAASGGRASGADRGSEAGGGSSEPRSRL